MALLICLLFSVSFFSLYSGPFISLYFVSLLILSLGSFTSRFEGANSPTCYVCHGKVFSLTCTFIVSSSSLGIVLFCGALYVIRT